MAINADFYATVNELMERASGGTITDIVDYRTFIDAGKKLSDISSLQDITNAFAAEIANKVKLTINIVRNYKGKLRSLIRDRVSPNGIIELITNGFFETREAAFANLVDGDSVDMYVINKGTQWVDYFAKDNTFQINCTIQADELMGAFNSPEAMDRFLSGKIAYMLNSGELAREQGRRSLLGDLVVELSSATAATDIYTPAQRYELVTLFNTAMGLSGDDALDEDNALYNGEFVRFAVSVIRQVRSKLTNPSYSYNSAGHKVFTPDADIKTIIHSGLEAAMRTYVVVGNVNGEKGVLENYETVDYWQSEHSPFTVSSYVGTPGETAPTVDDETETAKVVALVFDTYAVGEYPALEDVSTTPYNSRGRYTNDWLSVQTKLVRNKNANAVLFTLE